jgi:hypothetical protein
MAKSLSFSPLQLFTPIQLIFCLILFFLPWIDVQCVIPKDQLKDIPKEEIEKSKKEIGWDPTTPFSMVTQSGLQIATGESSPGSDMQRVLDKMNKELGGKVAPKEKFDWDTDPATGKKTEKKGAPMLFVYAALLLAGIVIGFIPWAGWVRRIVLASVVGGAFMMLGLQALLGFPVEVEMRKKFQEASGAGAGFNPFGGFGAPKAPPGKAAPKNEVKPEDVFRVSWKFPLYVTFLLLLAAGGTSFLDAGGGGGKKSKHEKRRRGRDDYDDDDEDDDDEDYRPAKKKRRDEDDKDEDDRPRKKKRQDDEDDEDDRPRKKKVMARVDDDVEDERPAKKSKPAFEVVSPPAPAKAASPPAAPRPSGQRPGLPPPPTPPPAAPAGSEANPFAFDDDDEPKSRKKARREDDDDDRPRKKRPRDDDEDDDRPRKKRRRDDD